MKTSSKGIDLIKQFEGFKPSIYLDSAGVRTIGYGTALFSNQQAELYEGREITKKEAEQLLKNHLTQNVEIFINSYISKELSQNEFDALASFIYNVGSGNFINSTLRKKINQNAPEEEIKSEFKRWNKATIDGQLTVLNGLTRRREAEAKLYFEDMDKKKSDFRGGDINDSIRDSIDIIQEELRKISNFMEK